MKNINSAIDGQAEARGTEAQDFEVKRQACIGIIKQYVAVLAQKKKSI